MTDAVFEPDGHRLVPTGLARGPWRPDALHGAPPSCALARAAARHGDGETHRVARITVELVRPVPLEPLSISVEAIRPGRNVELLELTMRTADTVVARARALRLRVADLTAPVGSTEQVPIEHPDTLPETPVERRPRWHHGDMHGYATHAVDHRFAAGGFGEFGDAVDWVRLRHPLVAGEPNEPIVVAMAAADFGNGVSARLSRDDGWTYVNPDLTVHLHRLPVGEWVRIESTTSIGDEGIGMAESRMADTSGLIGRAVQSLLVDRPGPPD